MLVFVASSFYLTVIQQLLFSYFSSLLVALGRQSRREAARGKNHRFLRHLRRNSLFRCLPRETTIYSFIFFNRPDEDLIRKPWFLRHKWLNAHGPAQVLTAAAVGHQPATSNSLNEL